MSGHVYATRDGREQHFIAPREHWRFLLTWSPSGNTAEFPRWVPWVVPFTLLRRFHDLIDSPKFAGYSADLQAIELNRALKPLLDRLSGEDFLPQEFAAAGAELSVEQVLPRFQRLLSGLTE
jgi:hypothetical protein